MKREYKCLTCGARQERDEALHSVMELPPLCPICKTPAEWAPTGMNFSLKGKGWTPKGDR